MIGLGLMAAMLLAAQAAPAPAQQTQQASQTQQAQQTQQAPQTKPDATPEARAASADSNAAALNTKLLQVTRIYIDDFGSEPTARQIQAMVVNSISESKRFIITENKDKADAILKGTALEKSSQEFHSLNDQAAAAISHGAHSGEVNGTFANGTGSVSGRSSGYHSGSAMAADDSTASTETINDARVAVRLVAADGDVIWSTTQESRGAKYKGASADVADKVVKQLMRDLEKLQAAADSNKPK
ncbi:MAG TPA: hypothetical protein VN176_18275 [Verrucomicrobiae bacterium]|jgi:hypothetical protein|nr:hypothetical protein [Verrucomicrobiae bacterium]